MALSKKAIIAKLEELGIEHDPNETVAVLKALLPIDASTDESDESDEDEDEESGFGEDDEDESVDNEAKDEVDGGEEESKADEPEAVSVTVRDSKDGTERTYSLADHGEGYRALAKEFASKVSTRELVA